MLLFATRLYTVPPSSDIKLREFVPSHNPFEDFQDAYNHIQQVKQDFMQLPSRVRARFDNNPANVVRFVDNPANAVEAIKMGLFNMPEGYEIKGGKLVEQIDLEKESENQAPKADSEANPSFKK